MLRAIERLGTQEKTTLVETVAAANTLQPIAARVEHTLARGIIHSFGNDLYLVPNENLTRRRHSFPWVSARHSGDEHPLLAAARDTQTVATHLRRPQTAEPVPVPQARHDLHQALLANGPSRTGPPAMSQL